MTLDRGGLRRLMSGADPLDVLGNRRQPDEAPDAIPLPDTLEAFMPFVYWPHLEKMSPGGGPLPVNDLNPMQREFLANRASWRTGPDGQPVGGSDVILKPRRVRATSLVLAMCMFAACRYPNTVYLSIFQTKAKTLIDSVIDQYLFGLARLPASFLGVTEGYDVAQMRVGNIIRYPSGSRHLFASAGSSKRVSRTTARGHRVDGLHLSEARAYAEPEEVWAAAGKALSANGWAVCESTPSANRESWFANNWLLTRDGVGAFDKAHFFPWYKDPLKRLSPTSAAYQSMTSTDFVECLPSGMVADEDRLGLDLAQRAYRRRERATGDPWTRRLAVCESPETPEEVFVDTSQSHFLDRGAVELCRAQVCPPIYRERLGSHLSVSLWEESLPPGSMLLMFADTAQKSGVDYSAIRCRASDKTVLGEVHGRGLVSELAAAVEWLINHYCGHVRNHTRYCIAVERNAGTGRDLLDHLVNMGIPISTRYGVYAERVTSKRPGARGRQTLRPGLQQTHATRAMFLERIAHAVEGTGWSEVDNSPVPLGPSGPPFRSEYLVNELAALVEIEGRWAAPSGGHDDLAIADGGALYLAERLSSRPLVGVSGGGRPGRGARRVSKSRAKRKRPA